MDQREKELRENYEDALFALWMDGYAREAGKQLRETEREIKDDPAYAVPEDLEAAGLQTIRRTFRKQNWQHIAGIAKKITVRVAVVVLALNVAFGVSMVSVEAFRTEVLNLVLSYCETHTSVRFTEGDAPQGAGHMYTAEDLMAVLPEEYTLTSRETTEELEIAEIAGPDGIKITWDVFPITTSIGVDNENVDAAGEVTIGGLNGMYTEKNHTTIVVLGDTEKMYEITANVEHQTLLDWLEQVFS